MDLPLFDADGRPLRPPRRDGKKRSMVVVERVEKRDVRLLSVPNIKYTSHHHHHHEPQQCKGGGEQWVYDLRDKEDITPASFGGLMKRFNKLDSSFSRSRSSSMSSLENISSEAIQCLAFADSYTKKSEPCMFPTLWVGTSLGSVLTIMINLPPPGETRITQPVVVSPCGTIFRLKGSILTMSFLDCNGALIPYSFETWRDENKDREKIKYKSQHPVTLEGADQREGTYLVFNGRLYGDMTHLTVQAASSLCSEGQLEAT
uniref:Uncharacterized protein n=1 Tax=Timema genevievae TaxID=629358 RepID=A0A7R9PL45_TIMGE|nr:unnamed protein product [Timema genevievae]